LVNGQRLSRTEFHERYEAMPPDFRAELIGGVVYVMSSPVSRPHGRGCANVNAWLVVYRAHTPGVEVLDNATTELDEQGEPQPDASLRILPEYGGQSRDEGKYVGGSPELVVEVADSSRKVDLGAKLADYERTGTLEYVVAAVDPAEVFYFLRQGDRLV